MHPSEEPVVQFKSDTTRRIFDSLVDSFIEDYMVRKYVAEKSGWRTIVDIADKAHISTSVLYGKHSTTGPHFDELVRRGLIERRVFPGERGRGGEVIRFRIAYDKEPLREFVNNKVMQGRNKITKSTPRLDKFRVAVLPFLNLSPDSEDEYFADGLTEELISTMSKVSGLKVIARTSIMAYKSEPKKKVDEIARELRVGTLVEGSARKIGEKLRITVQVVDCSTSEHIFSESYDRELKDIFEIQSDISKAVAEKLRVKLLPTETTRIAKNLTLNSEAHLLYLKGLQFHQSWKQLGRVRAIDCFEQAIRLDPKFAAAYAALSYCYTLGNWNYLGMSFDETISKAKQLITKALEFDPDLSEAHQHLGDIEWYLHGLSREGWLAEEREYRRAIELNPGSPQARLGYALHLLQEGKFQEAKIEIEKMLEIDPMFLGAQYFRGEILFYAREYEEAEKQLEQFSVMAPQAIDESNMGLGRIHLLQGRFDEAISELTKAVELSEPEMKQLRLSYLAIAYAKSGKVDEAHKLLEQVKSYSKFTNGPKPSLLARISLALDEKHKAMQFLERAYEEKEMWPFVFVKVDPFLDELHSDPSFAALLEKIGLNPPGESWRSS